MMNYGDEDDEDSVEGGIRQNTGGKNILNIQEKEKTT